MSRNANLAQPQSTKELIAILERETEERRQNVRLAKWGSLGLVLGLFALALVAWLLKGTPVLTTLQDFSAFFLVALGGVALSASHREALLQANSDDPRLAGFLIEALSYRDREVARHAERVLIHQLPHSTSLSPYHSNSLAARLDGSRDPGFIGAALKALRSHGGTESLESIDRFARTKPGAKRSQAITRLQAVALETSADIRLRCARQIIETEEQLSTLRLQMAGGRPAEPASDGPDAPDQT